MASLYFDAVEVITDRGDGLPVSYTNTAIGLASDGHFALITGRPGLDGSKTITGDSARGTWYERLLADSFNPDPEQNINFEVAGAVAQVSAFSFDLINTALISQTLKTNSVWLGRCTVIYYRVTSSDGLTFNFEKRWTGVIDEITFSELVLRVRCMDNSKDIFGSLPKRDTDASSFPEASKASLGKPIPLAMGRVGYSPLANVSTAGTKAVLVNIGGVERTICAAKNFNLTNRTVDLYTPGVGFGANDNRLVEKYLSFATAGANQNIRIASNLATALDITQVTLDEPWTGTLKKWTSTSQPDQDVWYFEVNTFASVLLASHKAVAEFKRNSLGQNALYTWDSESKAFLDLAEICLLKDESNIGATGFPGIKVVARAVDEQGGLNAYFGIRPASITLASQFLYGVLSGAIANVIDGNFSTFIEYQAASDGDDPNVKYDLEFPKSELSKSFDEMYLLVDLQNYIEDKTQIGPMKLLIDVAAIDIYGRVTSAVVNGVELDSSLIEQTGYNSGDDVYTIPSSYYNSSAPNPALFFSLKGSLKISTLITSLKESSAYTKVRVTIRLPVQTASTAVHWLKIREIAFVGKKVVNFTTEPTFTTLLGETFGTTWNGRKSPSSYIGNPAEALEHLLRNYDYDYGPWKAATVYAAGDIRRPTADNSHFYIATTGGTSHASTEPTWPTTAGATVGDGTVTWKELGTLKIDEASFDTLSGLRQLWFIGRTLTEKRNSMEYYKELAAQAFFLVLQDPQGRVKVNAWRENTTPAISFDTTNILAGSLKGEMELTEMRQLYNDLLVRYDKNPASGDFNKQVFVTNIDKPAFPAANEFVGVGRNLGTFTIETTFSYPYIFFCTTTAPHGLKVGDYASLTGNGDGYNFEPRVVGIVASSTVFAVLGQLVGVDDSTSGTLYANEIATSKWMTYAGGFRSYSRGKTNWELAHASYQVSKIVQKMPQGLGDCEWFPDPYATDPAGNRIWPELEVGDDHAAVYFLENALRWMAWQKKRSPPFEIADTAAHAALLVGTPANLTHAKVTAGVTMQGWIYHKKQLPATDTKPPRFRIRMIFPPEQLVDQAIIDPNGAAAGDIIDPNGASATDIIDPNGA